MVIGDPVLESTFPLLVVNSVSLKKWKSASILFILEESLVKFVSFSSLVSFLESKSVNENELKYKNENTCLENTEIVDSSYL